MTTRSEACIFFRFKTHAEVDFALAQNWDGTLSPLNITNHLHEIFTYEFKPYVWKVGMIRNMASPRIMKDTWLTAPYNSRLQPKRLPS